MKNLLVLKSFLSTVTVYALENYSSKIKDLHFIFPNRRAVTVFKHHLVNLVDKPIWTPAMSSIDDWMKQLSEFEEAEKTSQLLNLYISVRNIMGQEETLDNFLRWGDMLLRDFDEIDKYLVPVGKVFKTIRDIKEIEMQFPSLSPEQLERFKKFWDGFHPTPSTYQKSWLKLWQSLEDIYKDFHGRLSSQGLSTSGRIYRSSLEKLIKDPLENLSAEKYLFIGFNALTEVEERIFEICQKEGKAEFFWDVPGNILAPYQNSGIFIRNNLKKYPTPSDFADLACNLPDRFNETRPANFEDVNIYACESGSGQIGLLHQLISDRLDGLEKEDGQKAVILSDESLLEPVLSAISSPDNELNISMGFPGERSLIAGFLSRLIEIHSYLISRGSGKLFLPTRDLVKLFSHPLMVPIMGQSFVGKFKFIEKWPTTMLPLEVMLDKQEALHLLLSYRDQEHLIEILENILEKYGEVLDKSSALESETTKKLKSWLQILNSELKKNDLKIGYETFKSLFKEYVQKLRLPFQGSLDAGIQLTGILETRLMDYDEILILSCNEGVWPVDSSPPSLIPFSLRKAYDLPTRELSDSFYGYYFYRLLQRAKKVSLMYVNSPNPATMSQGDPSRFIQQLKYDSNQFCNEYEVASSISPGIPDNHTIKKTGVVLASLSKYLDSSKSRLLSPSAINTYIDCPLRFALQYMLRIREGDDLSEAGEPRMFGLLMHKSLEIFYQDFKESGKPVSKDFLDGVIKNKETVDNCIKKAFLVEYFKTDGNGEWPELFGKDLLVYEVISKQFMSVLLYDKKIAPFSIKELEGKVQRPFSFSINGAVASVNLGGFIDRMDEKDGVIRILDYKSGNPNMSFTALDDLFDNSRNKRPREILQASIYSILTREKLNNDQSVKPIIYPTGKMRSPLFDPGIKYGKEIIQDIKDIDEEIRAGLQDVLSEMFYPDVDFTQTENENNCKYCPFKHYCRR